MKQLKRANSKLIIVSIAIIAVISSVIWYGSQSGKENPQAPLSQWVRGNSASSVILVEYLDFQCPACGTYYPIVNQLVQEFGDRVRFEAKHFPLRQIHRHADIAARAAQAAGQQGKFWEMHDLLFERQRQWANERDVQTLFKQYAQSVNLDVARFAQDLEAKEVRRAVNNDYARGAQFGVNGTPTFFLNGKKLTNPRNYDEFKSIIQAALPQ